VGLDIFCHVFFALDTRYVRVVSIAGMGQRAYRRASTGRYTYRTTFAGADLRCGLSVDLCEVEGRCELLKGRSGIRVDV